VTKKLGFKALTLATGLGLSVVLVSGCNPEEPAKTANPPAVPPAVKPAPKPDTNAPAPAPAPKDEGKTK
jgi:hypothetical protein